MRGHSRCSVHEWVDEMAIANELTINTSATALDMANAIFGDGITVVSASYTGATVGSGIYSGANTTTPGISPTDSGVILSTGRVTDFTNSSGTTDTNTATGTGTDATGGVDGDSQLNAIAGATTYDGAILNASFIPDGNIITMQFVFSSEEYPEYVNGGYNDAFGVWVNGTFVPVTVATGGQVSIDTVNPLSNPNLYHSNANDTYNTEMDGFTVVLSFKAPVNPGQVNTIKIGIADAGDAVYDSNLMIMGGSIQTYALAYDDTIQLTANSTRTFDILANDRDDTGAGLTITKINGTAVVPGQTVTLSTGEKVTLNANGTVTVQSDGDIGSNTLTYEIVDSDGNTDVGYITVKTVGTAGPDGIVQGTGGDDLIDTSYLGDPDGDRIDNSDGRGIEGTVGNDDLILAGAGHDTVNAGAGNDVIYGGSGNDQVSGGAGNDRAHLGAGDDSFGTAADDAGNDTVYGDGGNDTISTGTGNDAAYGGAGNDVLTGGSGADYLAGDDDADTFYGGGGDTIIGGEGGTDNDRLIATGVTNVLFTPGNTEAGTVTFSDGSTLTFTEIEQFTLNGGNRDGFVQGTAGADYMPVGYVDAQGDIIDGGDSIFPDAQPDDDGIIAGAGNDTVDGGAGKDFIYGGTGEDSLLGGAGDDTMQGDEDNDILHGGEGDDYVRGDAGNDIVYGDAGNDSVYGGLNDDIVYGGAGNDYGYGGYGNDIVYGGIGDDTLTGSDGDDAVYGDEGNDSLLGSIGNDTFYGGTGNDLMQGEADADVFYGGGGDTVIGGETVTTGTDNDTLYVTNVDRVEFAGDDPENGVVYFLDGTRLDFFQIERVVVDGVPVVTPNYVVEGTAAGEVIDTAYTGDPGGDRIDASDNAGGNNDDLVMAGGGNDTVRAGDGADTLHGEAGDDLLQGGVGADELYGDAGNDQLQGDEGADRLYGGAGNDALQGGAGNDTLDGGSGDDAADGGAGDDSFHLSTGLGNGSITGGETGETAGDTLDLTGLSGVVSVNLTAANPEAGSVSQGGNTTTFTEIETIQLGAATETLVLADGSGADVVRGFTAPVQNPDGSYSGVDRLNVAALHDGEGNPVNALDVVVGNDGAGNAVLTFPNGETLTLIGVAPAAVTDPAALVAMGIPLGQDYIVEGTAGGDLIDAGYAGDPEGDRVDAADNQTGTDDDVIEAYGGNDTVHAGAGNDHVDGGTGDDDLHGGAGADTLLGGDGVDYLWGEAGNDSLDGAAGDDVLLGGDGDDSADGGAGGDILTGDAGNDTLSGGAGVDTLYAGADDDQVSGGGDGDLIYGEAGRDSLYGGDGDDTIYAGTEDDLVEGGGGADSVDADVGNDTVDGGEGDDTLFGRGGDDSLIGGSGDDQVYGGEGDDTLSGDAGNDVVDGDTGNDMLSGGTGDDTLAGDEGDDALAGGEGADELYGGIGNDTLYGDEAADGPGGNDQLYTGAGDDLAFGGAGDDLIYGEGGNDTLTGGTGNDTMAGGDDRDTFYGGAGDVIDGGEGGDDYDILDLTGWGHTATEVDYDPLNPENGTVRFLDADGNLTGTLSFSNIEKVIACFTPGSRILTEAGERAIEDLGLGDRILTRDSGWQDIRWIGRRDLTAAEVAAEPRFAPVCIAKGALGSGLPERDMKVSPQHRLLFAGPRAELLFGEHEVLVAAIHLVGQPGITRADAGAVSYIHLLFERHEIVLADGAWSESFQPGQATLDGLEAAQRDELLALFPNLAEWNAYPAARLALKAREVQVLLAA